MKDILVYGASGHTKVIIEIAESVGYKIKGLVDDNPNIKQLLDYPVNDVFNINIDDLWIIGVGNNCVRKQIVENTVRKYVTLIHKAASLSARSIVREGTVIMAGATINSEVRIGRHCIVNTNASVDHDCIIEDFVHISPNVALAGNVTVAEGSHIGIGACVIQGVKIGKWCTIGAGAVVIKDVPDGETVVGNPARVIKQGNASGL